MNILKKIIFLLMMGICSLCSFSWASEVSLYYLPNAQMEYEGTGFRQVPNGWELKVKPRSSGLGIRWRHDFSSDWASQLMYWKNAPFFDKEDGNTQSGPLRQTGQTKLEFHSLFADLRRPIREMSSLEFILGMTGTYSQFDRQSIVFNGISEPETAQESLLGVGAYFGFHGGSQIKKFYWDWDVLIGHLFFTKNKLKTGGGSIRQNGFTYAGRLEAGYIFSNFKVGLGYMRQLFEVAVPGGKALSTGAAASLPINKIDFFSPILTVSWSYQ